MSFRPGMLARLAPPACALLLAACVPRGSSPRAAGRPGAAGTPQPASTHSVSAPRRDPPAPEHPLPSLPTHLPDAGAAGAAVGAAPPTPRAADAATTSNEPPAVEIDTPYKLFERPRAQGTVYAAGRDQILARWNVGGTGNPSFVSNRPGYHPWPRVRVDTKVLRGRLPGRAPYDRRKGRRRRVLSVARLQAEARAKGYWPFRLCSEAGLRRDQKMHGQTVLRFSITTHGHVVHARLRRSKLGDPEVRACLRGALRKLVFTPAPSRRIDVELSVKLWPGNAPVPLIGPPDEDKTPDNPGQLDVSAVETTTESVPDRVRSCYAAARERDPHLWGRIQLRVDLDDEGRVRRVAEDESRFPDRAVVRCAVDALRSLRFPPAKGGALSFVYALRLGHLAPLPSASAENQ